MIENWDGRRERVEESVLDGKAKLLHRDSEWEWLYHFQEFGQHFRVIWNPQDMRVSLVSECDEADLSSCDCGHRHCWTARGADHKCRCGFCLRLGEMKL